MEEEKLKWPSASYIGKNDIEVKKQEHWRRDIG